jgi:FixJ family two-component response regulator
VDRDALQTAGAAEQFVVAVDDDFRVRESIESLVESAGYAPLMFASAEAFLESGALARATCLITDVRMPGMNGIELQRRIRMQRPKLPVIFISAHNDDEIQRRAFDEGAAGFLHKPFDAGELLEAVRLALTDSPSEKQSFRNNLNQEEHNG